MSLCCCIYLFCRNSGDTSWFTLANSKSKVFVWLCVNEWVNPWDITSVGLTMAQSAQGLHRSPGVLLFYTLLFPVLALTQTVGFLLLNYSWLTRSVLWEHSAGPVTCLLTSRGEKTDAGGKKEAQEWSWGIRQFPKKEMFLLYGSHFKAMSIKHGARLRLHS